MYRLFKHFKIFHTFTKYGLFSTLQALYIYVFSPMFTVKESNIYVFKLLNI